MLVSRFGRWSAALKFRPLRWLTNKCYSAVSLLAPILTGVVLPRGVRVGDHFHIIHAGGIVIHREAVFADRCGGMHNAPIGTNLFKRGVPRVGNDVFIGTGAVVVGPITIGD